MNITDKQHHMESVAATNSLAILTSPIECPASATITNLLFGSALCNSQALLAGQTTSYLPWTMVVGISDIIDV